MTVGADVWVRYYPGEFVHEWLCSHARFRRTIKVTFPILRLCIRWMVGMPGTAVEARAPDPTLAGAIGV